MNLFVPAEGERKGGLLTSSEACPNCGSYDNLVKDSRADTLGRRRRRRCNICRTAWSTIEVDKVLVKRLAAVVGRLDEVAVQINGIRELLQAATVTDEEVESEEG
jgi:transcriptional regulator NrdR family protein